MGGSACVAHGISSFGAFAAGLAGNRCRAFHRKPGGGTEKCPNGRGENLVMDITRAYVMSGNLSDLGEGRLPPIEGKISLKALGSWRGELQLDADTPLRCQFYSEPQHLKISSYDENNEGKFVL